MGDILYVAIPSVNQVVLIEELEKAEQIDELGRNPFSESGRSHLLERVRMYEADGRNPFSESGRSHGAYKDLRGEVDQEVAIPSVNQVVLMG